MENASDILMLDGVVALCADCGVDCIFVPVDDGYEFCCTSCDAAVFLLEVIDNTGAHRAARTEVA
ncbi:MAG TPA: hypothetical protein VF049_04920 [Nocardioidaceae bacterium]|jgi:hypothetical protein